MGATSSTNTSKLNLSEQTSITQSVSSSCITNCNAVTSNNTIILNNTFIGGDFTFDSSCKADMKCTIDSTFDSNVDNLISAAVSQANTTTSGLIPNITKDSNQLDVKEQITNSLSQYISSTCKVQTGTYFTGNTVVFNNSSIQGGVTLGAQGNANANCSLVNTASAVVSNNQQANTNQSNTELSLFATVGIILVIGIIIVVAAVVVSTIFSSFSRGSSTTTVVPVASNTNAKPIAININTPSGNVTRAPLPVNTQVTRV